MVANSTDASRSSPANGGGLAESVHEMILSLMRYIKPSVEVEGISMAQFWTMHVLSGMKTTSLGTIARHLKVTSPSVSVTIDQLKEAGFVTRERSSSDHRTVELSLTPRGRKVEALVWGRIERRISEAAGGLPPEEVAAAVHVIRVMNQHLDRTPNRGASQA